jgi:excisionase family DNA binding protein
MQMKHRDPRIVEFFRHVREAIDVLEHLALDVNDAAPAKVAPTPKSEMQAAELVSKKSDGDKMAYAIKEACQKAQVSRSKLYQAIGNDQLRAVKCGRKTLILTKDLQAWVDSWPARTNA